MAHTTDDIKERLISLLIETQVYDSKLNYVNLDRVWINSIDSAQHCARLLADYIKRISVPGVILPLGVDISSLVLLSPDTIRKNYGILPITILAASLLNCQFAVWKESTDFAIGSPRIHGPLETPLNCVIVQDVIDRGVAIRRMIESLKRVKWTLKAMVCFIHRVHPSESIQSQEAIIRVIEEEATAINAEKPPVVFIATTLELQNYKRFST
jgi:hypothetical protein